MINVKNNKLMIKKKGIKCWEYIKLYAHDFLLKYSILSILFLVFVGVIGSSVLAAYYEDMLMYVMTELVLPAPLLFWSSLSLFICYFISATLRYQLWKFTVLRTITFYDKYLCVVSITCFIQMIGQLYIQSELWWMYFISTLVLLSCFGLKLQMYRLGKHATMAKKSNIITLNDLYYNRVPDGDLILLDELAIVRAADDLLGIMPFVVVIHDMLVRVCADTTHVIALTGKWGSGKTSIMNLVQAELGAQAHIVVAYFSPWKYEDTYSLFKGFGAFIFQQLGDTFGYLNYKEYLRKYQRMLFSYIESKQAISFTAFLQNESNDIGQMRQIISDKIQSDDKKMIIIIDDIDRLQKEEILFIFKMIQTVFNFDHLIYVLNFDEDRISKIFKAEFATDTNYLDKIIQTKINVPQMDVKVMQEVGTTSLLHILAYYGVRMSDEGRLEQTLNRMMEQFCDLRDLTRFLNSVSTTIKNMTHLRLGLDISDLLVLEYIKYADLTLYYQLANNACFLISEDIERSRICDVRALRFHATTVFERGRQDASEHVLGQQRLGRFNEMFVGKQPLVELLSFVFPNIAAYRRGKVGESGYKRVDDADEPIATSFLQQRCYTGSFFDVYFNGQDNAFTRINKVVDQFIDEMNFINVASSSQVQLSTSLDQVPHQYQRLCVRVMRARMSEIDDLDKLFTLTISCKHLYEKYDAAALLLAAIIKHEQENPEKYLTALAELDLRLLDLVLSELRLAGNDARIVYGRELMNIKLSQKEAEAYDPFSKDEYKRGVGRLYSSPHYRGDRIKAAHRLQALVNQENIFRVIAEYVQKMTDVPDGGNGYYYDVSARKIVETQTIDKTLKHGFYELNADQAKIKAIYEAKGERVMLDKAIDFSNL
jgi:hypothetical protein